MWSTKIPRHVALASFSTPYSLGPGILLAPLTPDVTFYPPHEMLFSSFPCVSSHSGLSSPGKLSRASEKINFPYLITSLIKAFLD